MSNPNESRNDNRPAPAAKTARTLPVEVMIEFADDNNRQAMFPPLQERMRGRWDPRKILLGQPMRTELAQMPVIPGLYIKVNTRDKVGELIDPLGLPENRGLLAEVMTKTKALLGQPHSAREGVRRELTNDEMASWLYWMGRHVRAKQAVVITGEVFSDSGSEAKIAEAMPGAKIRQDYFDILDYSPQGISAVQNAQLAGAP